jgi:DHA1 family bicyclomycin/chloramphenicol resistance-like MFS transporter
MKNPSVLALALLMSATAFAVDASIPSIPTLASFFGAEIGTAQLIVGLYLLGYGLGQIPMGFLADYFGRRIVVLTGMSLFVATGLLTTLSPSLELLLVARFFQGLFGASGAVISRAIARDITEGKDTVRLLSLLTSVLGFAMIIAPVIGGIMMQFFGWRGAFGASALLGALGLGLAIAYLPETLRARPTTSLLATTMHSVRAFGRSRQSLLGMGLVGLTFSVLATFITTASEFLIGERGLTELGFATFFSTMSVGYMSGAFLSRGLARTLETGRLIVITGSGFLTGAGLLVVVWWSGPAGLVFLLPIFTLIFACVGAMLSIATSATLAPLPKSAGMAAALLGTFQILCGSAMSLVLTSWTGETGTLIMTVCIAGGLAIFLLSVFESRITGRDKATSA